MSNDIVDIDTALKLKGFYFRTPRRIRGNKAGIHKSYYKGISPDFLEHNEYHRGDELKQVDWRLYGRHDRLYVKKFEDEVNLKWCLLVDTSESMNYGAEGATKLDHAKSLSGTLAYLLLSQGDSVGTGGFSGDGLNIIPPRSSSSFITPITQTLLSLTASGSTEFTASMIKALNICKGDAVFVLFSDFLIDEEKIEETIQLLKAAKKSVVLFHILHPDEINFDFGGSIEFQDMESDTKVIVDAGTIRNTYMKRISDFMDKIKQIGHENETSYVFSPIGRPIEEALLEIADK